ncbi:MAG TPA: ABC transporter permease [Bacteroidales bacterium]|nr:ABC transporter permease [Bacteroidales bacterium]
MELYSKDRISKAFRKFSGLVTLNVFGLSLGLAAVIYISIWVSSELGYDSFFPNADRIYRVESLINFSGDPSVWTITPAPVAASVKKDFPEVEDAVLMQRGYQRGIKVDDKLFTVDNLFFTDHSYFTVFSPQLVKGNLSELLTGPDEIVISRRIAGTLFGDQDPIGKTVLFNNSDLLTVTGVLEDSPLNTHLKVDYLVPFSLLKKEGQDLESWGRIDFMTYILLKKQADPEQFNDKLSGYWQTKIQGPDRTLFINPLTRVYLYRDPGFGKIKYPYANKGPITRVILFSVIGIVLLLIACINFINLSVALASRRAKEIGVRKVNGASRKDLILHLFGESLLQTSVATIAALIIVMALLPVFSRVSGMEYSLSGLFSLKNILIYLSLTLFTGFIAGLYPAVVLSSFNPIKVIKPMPEDIVQGTGLRKILVIIQFGLAFIFIFCILVINKQISFMQKSDLGFDKERMMVLYPRVKPENIDAIAAEIAKFPGVKGVAVGGNVPVNMGNFNTITKWDGNDAGTPLMFFMMQVDDDYLDLLNIKLIDGRKFFKGNITDEVIVNEAAVRKMEMKDPLGKTIWSGKTRYSIVGVVKDFHFHKLKEEVKPVFIFKRKEWWMKMIFVKLEPGDHSGVVNNITDLIKKNAPGYPVNYRFLDQEAEKYYDNEKRLSTLVNAATILSIVISCIGLFSLTAFTIRKRSREIGVRKAYGATTSSVLLLLQKDFSRLVLISSLIAIPAGFYIVGKWLNSYASHIKITPVYFIAAILIIVTVAALTLIFHSVRAANLNPAETLKNE